MFFLYCFWLSSVINLSLGTKLIWFNVKMIWICSCFKTLRLRVKMRLSNWTRSEHASFKLHRIKTLEALVAHNHRQNLLWTFIQQHFVISCLLCVLVVEPDLKKRIRVHLLNAHGLDEAGIDGGGIFREFLNELLKSGFNPNQGFFKTTNEGLLYPSPAAEMLVGDSFTRHYYFLGRILGKVSPWSWNPIIMMMELDKVKQRDKEKVKRMSEVSGEL